MRWIFALVAVPFLASVGYAELVSTQWNGSALHMHWDDEDDWIGLAQDNQGYLTLQSDPEDLGLGPRVVSDTNSLVPAQDIDVALFHLSGGDDTFARTSFSISGEGFFFGGPGDDQLRLPYAAEGSQLWAWGGGGDDYINAYDSYETYLYGGDGNDYLMGGYQGYHVRDAGPGVEQIVYGARYGETDIYYHPGSNLSVSEIYNTPTNYLLAPGSSNRVGDLFVYDPYGKDMLTLNGHDFSVDGTTIEADWLTGQWYGFDGVTITDGTLTTSTPEPATWLLALVASLMGWGISRR